MPRLATKFAIPVAHRVAKERLMARIGSEWGHGARVPPIAELARLIDAGQRSTGVAVQEMVRDGWLVSKRRLGTYVARVPEAPTVQAKAAAVAAKRITLVTEEVTDPLILSMVRAAGQTLRDTGMHVVERVFAHRADGSLEPLEPCDLAILFNPFQPYASPIPSNVPRMVASTSWHEQLVARLPCDMIGVDQAGGAFLVGEFLREAGFTQACFIGVKPRSPAENWEPISALRLRGFEAGFGQPVAAEHQFKIFGYSVEAGGYGFRRYMECAQRPPAIFAVSDEIAVGFVIAAEAQGMRPGRDFHLLGFDGQKVGRQLVGGALTTVDVPAQAMGRMAAEVAIQRLQNPQRPVQITYLTCQLYRGATVGSAVPSSLPS